MNKNPLVCICIPNYNNENTISETLDSIINQTYKNIIIKVFDNASTDESINILRKYENNHSNIQVFQNDTNIGGEANFTKCIQNMEGEYSAIYHADDVYMPTIIEEQVNALSSNDISAIFVNANQINENGVIIGKQFYPTEFTDKNFLKLNFNELFYLTLKYGNFLTCPSCMAKTSIYKIEIKSWNGNDFHTSADLDVWLRFSQNKEIGIINRCQMNYRLSTSSYSYSNAKLRTKRHDLFLVLNFYMKKLSMEKNNYYNLLLLKDNSEIVFNKLMKQEFNLDSYYLDIFNINNFINAVNNKRLFKYYLFAISLKLLIAIGLKKNNYFLGLLYKIRFKK